MLLRTENLSRNFGTYKALNNFNISIDKGTIVGFVGPNGAGKTTAMRIMATLMPPSSGEVFVNDLPISKNLSATRKAIGYVPDYFGVYNAITSEEYLDFYADVNNISRVNRTALIDEMLELVNLSEKKYSNVNKLSRGMKQRLSIARCLLHDPELLILDEPASGLDPQARADLKYILKALKQNGKAVLISSHILPELGEFCDKVVILNKGRKLAEGSVDGISNAIGNKSKVSYVLINEDDFEIAAAIAKNYPKTGDIIRDGMTLEVEFTGNDAELANLTRNLILSGVSVASVNKTSRTLEQVFLEVIGNAK